MHWQKDSLIADQITRSPAPHRAYVHMHEVRLCVITDAASVKSERSISDFGGRYSRNANVDSFCFHVLAVQRNAAAMLAEIIIAPWGAISADDVYLTVEMPEFG